MKNAVYLNHAGEKGVCISHAGGISDMLKPCRLNLFVCLSQAGDNCGLYNEKGRRREERNKIVYARQLKIGLFLSPTVGNFGCALASRVRIGV